MIQLPDVSSSIKLKSLHPLEEEIQRDLEIKQQQSLTKGQAPSVIQSTSQTMQDEFINKCPKVLQPNNQLFDRVMDLQTIQNGRESVVNVSQTSLPATDSQSAVEKRQFIIVSNDAMLFNIDTKENKAIQQDLISNNVKSNELKYKPLETNISLVLSNNNNRNKSFKKEVVAESDSENEEDDIEPVYDYEPDPDTDSPATAEHLEKPNKCYMCFRTFRQKKNMYAHIRKIHSTQPKIEGGILCPLCKMHALRQEHLRNHLETLHEIPIEKEEKLFNTIEGKSLFMNVI